MLLLSGSILTAGSIVAASNIEFSELQQMINLMFFFGAILLLVSLFALLIFLAKSSKK